MTEENITSESNSTTMTDSQWKTFAGGVVAAFLSSHNLQKVTVDDGAGKKAVVKLDSKGNLDVTYTIKELM